MYSRKRSGKDGRILFVPIPPELKRAVLYVTERDRSGHFTAPMTLETIKEAGASQGRMMPSKKVQVCASARIAILSALDVDKIFSGSSMPRSPPQN
jgi:hypothetical protein